jgi:hypothetical protein
MRYYCTYFNEYYAHKYLALVSSMEEHCGDYLLYSICMDEASFHIVRNLNNSHVQAILWSDYEQRDTMLIHAKANRSLVEYFFTCSAVICFYFLQKVPKGELLTYLDCDMFFYSNPEPIFSEMENKSIGIIEHKFHGLGKRLIKYGIYNVGWVNFRNDDEGVRCVSKWRQDCLDWCYDKLEDGKFADQKYLEKWPDEFKRLQVIQHIGANVAPWNVGLYVVSKHANTLLVNKTPIIFYHFAGFKKNSRGKYTSGCGLFFTRLQGCLRHHIYQPYTNIIEQYHQQLNGATTTQLQRGKKLQSVGIKKLFKSVRHLYYRDFITANISR